MPREYQCFLLILGVFMVEDWKAICKFSKYTAESYCLSLGMLFGK